MYSTNFSRKLGNWREFFYCHNFSLHKRKWSFCEILDMEYCHAHQKSDFFPLATTILLLAAFCSYYIFIVWSLAPITNSNSLSNQVSGYLFFTHFQCISHGSFLEIIIGGQKARLLISHLSHYNCATAAGKYLLTSVGHVLYTGYRGLCNVQLYNFTQMFASCRN